MSIPTLLLDPDNKNFFKKLENFKKELGMKEISKENMKQVKTLKPEEVENKKFLFSFINQMKNTKDKALREMLECLELKRFFIGDFGRKAGYVYREIEEAYFRFIIHLGSPEIYYKDSDREKDKQIPMLHCYGLVIPPQESTNASFKIRPKDYKRTVLIYDFEYKFPESFLKQVEEELEDIVEEKGEVN